ncbi:MAG: DUF502 domain-containing protein [Phycisphaeraceae bacterium]|nr:DUF502 domain-containing protein [Phycisphaerales bacterium]MCB9859298.1 DUF502 domain-containing protein [Phycisphaeraceae bacterium]
MATERTTFSSDFRRFFFRGLGILLPTVLTLWILYQASLFVFNNVATPVNRGIRTAIMLAIPQLPEKYQPIWYEVKETQVNRRMQEITYEDMTEAERERARTKVRSTIRHENFKSFWEEHWYLEATGLLLAIVLIYLAGVLLGGLIGRKVYHRIEQLIARIPGFKQVYPYVKQVVDMVMGEKTIAFKRVVLLQWPSEGKWTIGFITNNSMTVVSNAAGDRCVTVFIPNSPTPFTGFAVAVPENEVIDLPISADEAIRYVLTGGVLMPERFAPPEAMEAIEQAKKKNEDTLPSGETKSQREAG